MSKKCLVTGCAGFIGSNLTKRLLNEGWDVTGVDDLSAGHPEFLPNKFDKWYVQDFTSQIIIDQISSKKFDVIFHLAAKPSVPYSMEYPYLANDTNVNKTVKLLEVSVGNVKRFINTSSSAVYGNAHTKPTHEEIHHDPQSPYALQKSITEKYCKMFSMLYGLDTVSIRPFNVFGPNQYGNSPYATAICAWFSAIKNNKSLRSDGTGEQARDMTFVDNVVDIMYHCGIREQNFEGRAYNAGTGYSISNNEILSWFKENYPKCEIVSAPERPNEIMRTCADIDRARKELGYEVKVGFWEGLERTKEWNLK